MPNLLDVLAQKTLKRSILDNLKTLEASFKRMNGTLQRILDLSQLDPRDTAQALQARVRNILFSFNVELSGIDVLTAKVEQNDLSANFLLKLFLITKFQLRKNVAEEEELQKLLDGYDGYTDSTFMMIQKPNLWVN